MTAPAPRSALPFSPLTDAGLSIIINDRASRVTYAVVSHRATDPAVVAEARLVYDMCRARTDRILADIRQGAAA